jgi:nitrate/nitrite transport system substrate-binding protein
MVKGAPDYAGITKKVIRQDIYLDAMKDMGVAPKGKDLQPVTFFDGTFDPNQAEKYALAFPVHSRVD